LRKDAGFGSPGFGKGGLQKAPKRTAAIWKPSYRRGLPEGGVLRELCCRKPGGFAQGVSRALPKPHIAGSPLPEAVGFPCALLKPPLLEPRKTPFVTLRKFIQISDDVLPSSLNLCLHLLPVLQIRFKSSKFEIRHDEVQQLEVELGSLVAPGRLLRHG
jgi:hypothetical protein